MKLTGRQIKTLWQAMLPAFSLASLKRLLRFELERDLEEIASAAANKQDAVFALLEKANQDRWIDQLVEAMRASGPANQQLQDTIATILSSHQQAANAIATAGIDPHTAYLIGRNVLINRDDLRNHMRHFTTAGEFDPRLIVVTGPDASGKTYTQEFVTYLTIQFKLNRPIYIELSAWPGGRCSPDDLIDSIARQMALDVQDIPADDEAQGARRAIKLKDWLVGKLQALDDEQWIILDDLDNPGVPNHTLELVDLLTLAVARNSVPRVRMLLLGYERPFAPDIRRNVLFEQLTPIDDQAVKLLARDLTAQYLSDAGRIAAEGTAVADAALQNLAPPFDREKLATLSAQLEGAVVDFLDRI